MACVYYIRRISGKCIIEGEGEKLEGGDRGEGSFKTCGEMVPNP